MDNFYAGGGDTASSASEFVFELSTGGHAQITDEAMGFGFITTAQYDDTACTAAQTLGGYMGEEAGASAITFSMAALGFAIANLF